MTEQSNATAKKPSHRIYVVIGKGKTATWRELGAAWPNSDGKGFSLTCDALPLQGRIVMREVKERPAKEGAAA